MPLDNLLYFKNLFTVLKIIVKITTKTTQQD